jgi:nicotinate-nucleotide--dimethylbenzimidazole phosphoribosyltransferase
MIEQFRKIIEPLDKNMMIESEKKWDNIAKPLKSMGRLEDMVIRLCGIESTLNPQERKKCVLVLCADNGVVEENISQSGNEVTTQCTKNFVKGIATVNILAKECNADVFPIDIGIKDNLDIEGLEVRKIANGTKNFAKEPAMTKEEAEKAIMTGIYLVREKKEDGYNLIVTGEMGIGNTTTSSAVFSALTGIKPKSVTGKGAGLTSEGVNRKVKVIESALNLHKPNKDDVIDILSKVGGFDICAMAGVFIGGAIYRVPIIVDGFISAVAANVAVKLIPECKDFIYASHVSSEPAGRMALNQIGLRPYLECGMCLGEGTGGVMGAKLFDFALAAYKETANFDDANVEKYEVLK